MLTFSINKVTPERVARVMEAIKRNIQYFKAFNRERCDEAVNKTFELAVEKADFDYESIDPYIKNLARNILKITETETAYDPNTEDGEVAHVFIPLATTMDDSLFVDAKELLSTFKELYLKHESDFMRMRMIFSREDYRFYRNEIVQNPEIKSVFEDLRSKYSANDIYNHLYTFFKNLGEYTRDVENGVQKIIEMRIVSDDVLDAIPDIPLIKDADNNYYAIDKNNLRMDKNPDTFVWDVVVPTSCNIMQVDITPLMDYMYSQIFVPKGVNTRQITWCDDMYRLKTPAGAHYVNLDRDKFINVVRIELIKNLIHNRLNTIIAVSPDSIFIKPARALECSELRLLLDGGKIIDLPVYVHIRKRK